jgi:hypothetical protein
MILILVLVLIGLSSCSNYYKVLTASEPKNAAIYNDFGDSSKYYILRNMNDAFVMKNISFCKDRKNVQCTLEELPFNHKLHINHSAAGKMKYKTKSYTDEDETGVLNEIHIYLTPGSKTQSGAYTLAFENIQKTEIIEKDTIKTKRSHVTGTAIGVSGTVIGVLGIAALVLSSITLFSF